MRRVHESKELGLMPDKVEKVINELKEANILTEGESFLLHGARFYRNIASHQRPASEERPLWDAVLILLIPMLRKLDGVISQASGVEVT